VAMPHRHSRCFTIADLRPPRHHRRRSCAQSFTFGACLESSPEQNGRGRESNQFRVRCFQPQLLIQIARGRRGVYDRSNESAQAKGLS
jgi:hypothetical protein